MTFTPEQIKNYVAYEKVRSSNRYNMLDPRAQAMTGLNRDAFLFVLKNFEGLQLQYREQHERLSSIIINHKPS